MSQTVSAGYGSIQTIMRNVDRLTTLSDALTAETSSGAAADSFAGLGDQAYQAISLEPQISATAAWQSNLSASQIKLDTTQTALSSISTIAANLQSSLSGLTGLSSTSAIATLSKNASDDLTQLTSLLNTQSGDDYVFAGSASDQPPVASGDLASSTLVASIIQSVASVGTTGAASTETAILASSLDNSPAVSPFSTQLSTSAIAASALAPSIEVGPGQSVTNGLVATQGGAATAQSTGSPIRDLISCLATLAGLSGADSSSSNFTTLVTDTATQLQSVSQGLANLTGNVGASQADNTARSSAMSDLSSALQTQLGGVKDADTASVASQQLAVQNQLSASYSLIADMKTLSLAAYL